MAKKKQTDEEKRPAYGERPEPVECVPCEPEPMCVPITEDDKDANT